MRILHVVPAIAPRYGGPSAVALEASRALIGRGHEVVLATTDADGGSRLRVPTGRIVEHEGVRTIFFPRVGNERFKWSPKLSTWLSRSVAGFELVDVHAIFSHSSIAAGAACRRADVPYLVRPHGMLDPWSLSRSAFSKRLLLRFGSQRLLEGAARVQYTTAEEQRLAERTLPGLPRGVIVPLGVPDECFADAANMPADPPYVLTLSRLDEKKNLDRLISAFHAVAATPAGAKWELAIAGSGEASLVRRLRAAAMDGPAASRIRFAGWVAGEEKRQLIRAAALFASPSSQENFGLAAVEAMAAGVPVLIGAGVNLAPDVQDAGAGWIVPADGAIAPVLRTVLSEDTLRAVRGRAARRLAQRFTWANSTAALLAAYRDVLQRDRGGAAA